MRAKLQRAGQDHLLRFWADLAPEPRAALLAELSSLEADALREHCQRASAAGALASGPLPDLAARLQPLPPERLGSAIRCDQETRLRWEEEGFRQIAMNKVAVLLLAGGQGTRLGVTYPKGMYQVGLPSQKTLYQLQAERIRRVQQLAGQRLGTHCTVPWYIMTSEFTLGPTTKFFKEHDFFHLDPANVVLFEQRMLPAVTFEGKAILERKDKVAMAPDGNGGLYCALADHQILEDMEQRGVEFVHVYCVDNILVRLADPAFIGFCVLQGADCGAKVSTELLFSLPLPLAKSHPSYSRTSESVPGGFRSWRKRTQKSQWVWCARWMVSRRWWNTARSALRLLGSVGLMVACSTTQATSATISLPEASWIWSPGSLSPC